MELLRLINEHMLDAVAVQMLSKKDKSADGGDDESFLLTPSTEDKYKRINEEFDNMMQRNVAGARPVSVTMSQQHQDEA